MGLPSSLWQDSIKPRLYFMLRRFLSQGVRDKLKGTQGNARRRMGKALSLVHGSFSAADLVDELRRRLPEDCDLLMVHSSYDRLLPMYEGSPQQILEELIAYCSGRRTLVMPAFCLGGRQRDVRAFYTTRSFDVRKTGSEMGLLTELFRRWSGVKRSLHPTHSICALGPLADELVAGHHLATTRTGYGTPFDLMAKRRCAIAGLGVEWFRVITQTHTAEDMLGDEFPVKFRKDSFTVTILDWSGNRISYELGVLVTDRTLDNLMLRSLLSKNELMDWRFRGTPLFVTYADRVTEVLLEAAKNGRTVYR